jgi:hypothetical protein
MLPQLPKDELRRVCDGCGTAGFLPYSIRIGGPATAVERVYCSIACARLHFPSFTGQNSGR